MIDVDDIRRRLADHSIVKRVDRLSRGHVRLETAFLYPEGSSVDLFLVEESPLYPPTKLTDLGHTFAWLLDVQVRPWLSKKRQAFVADALRIYGVEQQGGALESRLLTLEHLPNDVVRLGQACVRVADLVYTRRSTFQVPATEELEEVLADSELDYDPNAELEGRFGNRVRVDFLVRGGHSRSAILSLSSPNSAQSHVQANEIFRRWYDLDIPARNEQRVTIFDDRYNTYRDDDLNRLRDKSQVLALSDRTSIRDLLAA